MNAYSDSDYYLNWCLVHGKRNWVAIIANTIMATEYIVTNQGVDNSWGRTVCEELDSSKEKKNLNHTGDKDPQQDVGEDGQEGS